MSGVTREDCLALSRLYAVQLLSGLCGDFQAAADWLTGGGAGLSEEQQEVRHTVPVTGTVGFLCNPRAGQDPCCAAHTALCMLALSLHAVVSPVMLHHALLGCLCATTTACLPSTHSPMVSVGNKRSTILLLPLWLFHACCCCCLQLLLLEVDEAEELDQEEHVASWTTQDAAQAAQLGDHAHSSNGHAAADAAAYSDLLDAPGQDCCGGTDAGSMVGSLASTAAAALHELGPSVSGVLSNQSLHPAGESSRDLEDESTLNPEDLQQVHAAPSSAADGSSGGSTGSSGGGSQTAPAAAAGAQQEAAAAAEARLRDVSSLASPVALALPPAAVAVRGLEESERVPSSPSLASWRRSPDEVAVQDQSSQRDRGDSNPFVTITGETVWLSMALHVDKIRNNA